MKDLLQSAQNMRKHSHAPHSSFKVGAALLTEDGTIIGGCNVESHVYGLTVCAERIAIFNAISQGHKKFKALAVVTETKSTPCGSCRQIIVELCGNITIYIGSNTDSSQTTAYDLLPSHFTLDKHMNLTKEVSHENSL